MNFCLLCYKPSKSNSKNINEVADGAGSLLISDLIRIYLTFGERILNETKSEEICNRCYIHVNDFHKFHESVAINYGFYEYLNSQGKKEPENILYDTMQEGRQDSEVIDEQMIKIEEPEEHEEVPPIEMNWIDEFSQESVMTPMPEPVPSTSKERGRRGRPRKVKSEEEVSSQQESANDQRIRDIANTTCEFCFEDLINFREAKVHYKEFHGIEGYFTCCGRKFKQKCRLVDHVNLHYELAHNCTICGKSFNSKSYLMKHMACHEVEKEYQCDHCPKVFAKKFQVRNHLMSVHVFDNVVPQLECPMENCGKKFVNQARLKHHIDYTHASEDAVICDICSKTFKTKHAVEEHRQIHFKRPEDRIKCEICGHYLSNMKTYKRHRKNHDTESMENTCNFCGKVSPNQNALKKHIQYVHVRAATFQCRYCEKSFKRSRNLIDHEASVHTLQELYTCSFCPKTFRNQSNMLCHRKKMHPDLYKKPSYMRDEV